MDDKLEDEKESIPLVTLILTSGDLLKQHLQIMSENYMSDNNTISSNKQKRGSLSRAKSEVVPRTNSVANVTTIDDNYNSKKYTSFKYGVQRALNKQEVINYNNEKF